MAEFQILFTIDSTDDAEMLQAATWLKDNHAGKIHQVQGRGNNKQIRCTLIELTFDSMVATINGLKTQFSDRVLWEFTMGDWS